MYHTSGVDAVATITELRSKTSELIEYARQSKNGVLIQKNNEPYAVLLDWKIYQQLIEGTSLDADRPPAPRKRKPKSKAGEKTSS